MPILTYVRWHDDLYFHKTGVTPATRRVVRAVASRQRRPATAFASLRSPQAAARNRFCRGWGWRMCILRFFRTAQFAAAPLRRTATRPWLVRVLPPSANNRPKTKKCSPQDCAGRSLGARRPAIRMRSFTRPPQAAPQKHSQSPPAAEDKFCTQSITKNNGIPRGKMQGNLLLHSLIVIFAP